MAQKYVFSHTSVSRDNIFLYSSQLTFHQVFVASNPHTQRHTCTLQNIRNTSRYWAPASLICPLWFIPNVTLPWLGWFYCSRGQERVTWLVWYVYCTKKAGVPIFCQNKKKNVRLNTHTELHKGAYSHRYTIKSPLDTLPFANTRVFMHAPAHTHTQLRMSKEQKLSCQNTMLSSQQLMKLKKEGALQPPLHK